MDSAHAWLMACAGEVVIPSAYARFPPWFSWPSGCFSGDSFGFRCVPTCVEGGLRGGASGRSRIGVRGTLALYSQAGHDVRVIYVTRGERGGPGKSWEESGKIRSAEALLGSLYDNYHRAFRGSLLSRWGALIAIMSGLLILVVVFQRRKDAV